MKNKFKKGVCALTRSINGEAAAWSTLHVYPVDKAG